MDPITRQGIAAAGGASGAGIRFMSMMCLARSMGRQW